MTKDVIAAILERRSTRKFTQEPVPAATVGRIIDAARWAPSAGNIQPWEFYVVYNPGIKADLVSAALNQKFVGEAPVVIVVCVKPEMTVSRYRERGRNMYIYQDSAAAVQNILLAATGYGLGSCWVGAFDNSLVAQTLGIKEDIVPVAIIPIGYSAEAHRPPARRPVDELVKILE